jgi:MFS family permease
MAAFVAVSIVLPSTAHPTTHTLLAKLRRVDFLGALTLIVSVVTLLFALDSGANRGWSHAWTLSSLAVSLPFFALFALVETRIATDPFAPARVVLHPPVLATNSLALLAQGAQMSIIFLVPLFFQAVLGFSASRAGALLVPSTIALVVGAVGSGYVMRHTGRYRTLMISCQVCATLAISVIASGIAGISAAITVLGLTLGSIAAGPIFTAVVVALLAQMPEPTDTAVVVACQYLFRSLGNSVGVAASAAVLQNVLQTGLIARLSHRGGDNKGGNDEAREIARKVRRSLDSIKELEPDVARLVRLSYRDAALAALLPAVVMMVLGVVASLFIRNRSIKR